MKRFLRLHSVTFLLISVLFLGVFMPLAGGLYLSYEADRARLEDALLDLQETSVDALAMSTGEDMVAFSVNAPLEAARVLARDDRIVSIVIYSQVYESPLVNIVKAPALGERDLRAMRKDVYREGDVVGYVEIVVDWAWIQPQLDKVRHRAIAVFFLMFVCGLLACAPVVYFNILRPLSRLFEQAETLSRGNLEEEYVWAGRDEFSMLGRTLEKMRQRLNGTFNDMLTMATTDELTSLLNRRAFSKAVPRLLEMAERYKRPLSMALIDVDHFKSINDTYGHDIGDEVLRRLAEILSKRVRKSDFFARYGGEEFVLCLPETDIQGATRFMDELRLAVARSTFPHDRSLSISIGVAAFQPRQSLEELVKAADTALYSAKRKGRNRVEIFGG